MNRAQRRAAGQKGPSPLALSVLEQFKKSATYAVADAVKRGHPVVGTQPFKPATQTESAQGIHPLKGLKNGACNRTACQREGNVTWYNHSTRYWYCEDCAYQINKACRGESYHPLCVQNPDID